ncbi:MAG: hypothetical protein JRE24_01495, partial [Deltaproteobacteria bacterium]|nr:hypothetical protein [Deltaproteobacteria bacterium]
MTSAVRHSSKMKSFCQNEDVWKIYHELKAVRCCTWHMRDPVLGQLRSEEVKNRHSVYPPSQKTTGLPVDECANNQYATARCRPEAEADNRVVA